MNKYNFKNIRGGLYFDYGLARYTSWRVGGNAECCYRPVNLVDLQKFLQQVDPDEELTWLGLGSNTLIRDGGVKGTVIFTLNKLKSISYERAGIVRVEAGVTCAKLSRYCVQNSLDEGSFFAGIPGTVGGALAMNAGAYGGETWRHIVEVETIDRHGDVHLRKPDDFTVGYRQVIDPKGHYFVAGHFAFPLGSTEKAQSIVRKLLRRRNESQPIGSLNCGSVFRNPGNDYAARLIESAGLKRLCIGDAYVSDKHANFIINNGNACASDIEKLICEVEETVFAKYGVRLEREVQIIGRSQS